MRITNASMEIIDTYDSLIPERARVDLEASEETDSDETKAGSADIELTIRADLSNQASICRETYDPALASELGNDGSWVRTDWFIVHDARVTWLRGRIEVVGYMRGHLGVMRDGVSPRTGRRHPDPISEEDGEPYVRARWTLW